MDMIWPLQKAHPLGAKLNGNILIIVVSNCFSNNTGALFDGTQIAVPFSGLSLSPTNLFNGSYTRDGASKYGSSTSASTAP
jgi:hypothetical protein